MCAVRAPLRFAANPGCLYNGLFSPTKTSSRAVSVVGRTLASSSRRKRHGAHGRRHAVPHHQQAEGRSSAKCGAATRYLSVPTGKARASACNHAKAAARRSRDRASRTAERSAQAAHRADQSAASRWVPFEGTRATLMRTAASFHVLEFDQFPWRPHETCAET